MDGVVLDAIVGIWVLLRGRILVLVRQDLHLGADRRGALAGAQRQRVLQDATHDQLEGMLQDALPARGAAFLGAVAGLRQPDLARGDRRVVPPGGRVERHGGVELEDAAEEHRLRVAVLDGVRAAVHALGGVDVVG